MRCLLHCEKINFIIIITGSSRTFRICKWKPFQYVIRDERFANASFDLIPLLTNGELNFISFHIHRSIDHTNHYFYFFFFVRNMDNRSICEATDFEMCDHSDYDPASRKQEEVKPLAITSNVSLPDFCN